MDDVIRWIEGDVDDDQVEARSPRALLVNLTRQSSKSVEPSYPSGCLRPAGNSPSSLSIALPWSKLISVLTVARILPRVPGLLAKLSGDCPCNCLAAHRLHASGFRPPIRAGIYEPSDRTLRIAAAWHSISDWDTAGLLKQIQKKLKGKMDFQDSENKSRLLIEADLIPIQGTRFQPTGFLI